MPILSLRLTDEELQCIVNLASQKSLTTNEYVKSILFPHSQCLNALSHELILKRIKEKYKRGDKFSIPDLFTREEWQSFTNTISIGRTFRILSKNSNSPVYQTVSFVEKKSGFPAVYEVK